ncbi:inositol monophosphatase family protein [Aureimonas sp. AU40]|uniref:inositol monophosphatase family protein n=1 Tax=Aureimonas sp. AU40 TaxID=1637747 RepID=UPI000B0B1FD4|nr:inositol monophosphatase family protein [Aureimonas sp. AU40]
MTLERMARRDAASEIVKAAANDALGFFSQRAGLAVETKAGPRDFVSDADRTIETRVRALLAERFPGEAVVGEEAGGETAARYWIVDPIDGTSNFLAGSPLWGVSLGFVEEGEPTVGAIAAPCLGELMAGAKGAGVLRNGVPFERRVTVEGLGLVSIGDSPGEDLEATIALQRRLRERNWIVESFHCTSVSMLFAALGRFDGHIQPVTTMWDIAGGAAICRELGLEVEISQHADGAYGIHAGTAALLRDALGEGERAGVAAQ